MMCQRQPGMLLGRLCCLVVQFSSLYTLSASYTHTEWVSP